MTVDFARITCNKFFSLFFLDGFSVKCFVKVWVITIKSSNINLIVFSYFSLTIFFIFSIVIF